MKENVILIAIAILIIWVCAMASKPIDCDKFTGLDHDRCVMIELRS